MMKKYLLMLMLGLIATSLIACSSIGTSSATDKVVVGGKNFTEQDILTHIVATLIEENNDLEVERKPFLGGTQVVHNAMLSGDLDIYVEYTGTGWTATLEREVIQDAQETFDAVKAAYEEKFELTWLAPLGFNNTYALAMREDHALELGIETYSDLAELSDQLTLGATHEFLERADGYSALQQVYGMTFGNTRGMDPGLTYGAVREGSADVNDAFSTDGRIPAFNLKVLEDDLNFFPPYYAAPVVRMDTLELYPELCEVLATLANTMNDEIMAELNAKVDIDDERPQDVAAHWLREQGLIN